jgi:hypothetical protein
MTDTQKIFDALLRRRMAIAKAGALYQEAEAAIMQTMMMQAIPTMTVLAGIHLAKVKQLMAAADHIVRSELVDE